jgi:hypothetical protein
MQAFFTERRTEHDSTDKPPSFLTALWPMFINAWLLCVLVTFFWVRILGSSTGKLILNSLWPSHR